jgi:hypothetical protein
MLLPTLSFTLVEMIDGKGAGLARKRLHPPYLGRQHTIDATDAKTVQRNKRYRDRLQAERNNRRVPQTLSGKRPRRTMDNGQTHQVAVPRVGNGQPSSCLSDATVADGIHDAVSRFIAFGSP